MLNAAGRDRALVCAVALARTALCGWRAAHQSITIDEAHTFNFYVDGPWSNYYATYIPHNHVLFSLLARLSVALFGTSELAFRLPTVIAGFFLMVGIFAVLEGSVPRAIRWIAVAALALQPLLLDFSVAARGYGLGLALLVWAIWFCTRGRYGVGGVLLGLAISAQLSMAIPALAVVVATILVSRKIRPGVAIGFPMAVVAVAMCAVPLHSAGLASFNLGYATLRESLYSLVFPSTTDRSGMFVIPHRTAVAAEILVVLLVAAFIAIRATRAASLVPLAFVISAAAVVVGHYMAHMSYPVDRTGLYLILLFGLAWAIAAGGLADLWQRRAHMLLGLLFAIQFAAQFDARSFRVWKFDMDTRRVAEILREQCRGKTAGSVAVSATWINQQALEYYRRTLPVIELRPIEFHDPAPLSGYDFYVINAFPGLPQLGSGFRVLYAGAESGIVLATNEHE